MPANGVMTTNIVKCNSSLVKKELVGSSAASNLAFNENVKALKAKGETVYHFGFGESPFPIPDCMVQALQENAHQKEYLSIKGLLSLRQGIVKLNELEYGLELNPDNLIVAPGSKQLIYLIMVVFNGDVVVPCPAWTTYAPQVKLSGSKLVKVATEPGEKGGYKLSGKLLDEALEKCSGNTLLILTNPGNPTGTCFTDAELAEIAKVCRKHGTIVVSDEIYAGLKFDKHHHSIMTHYPEGVILTSGFSKGTSAGGWRLGYCHFPEELHHLQEAVAAASSQTHSCGAAPMQYAMAKVLKENMGDIREYMLDCCKILQAVGEFCSRELQKVGVTGTFPEAGYYFMPDFQAFREKLKLRGIITGAQMTAKLFEDVKVAVMPSSNFLMADDDLSTRFCFVCFDGGIALRAYRGRGRPEIDENFVREFCGPVVEGVEKLQDWCRKL